MKILNAFYDLKVSPCTFDIVYFLFAAEMYRRHLSLDAIDLFVVANDEGDGFRIETVDTTIEAKEWMLQHVLLQCHTLLKSCRRTIHCPSREEAQKHIDGMDPVYPANYSVTTPHPNYTAPEIVVQGLRGYPYSTLSATSEALNKVDLWTSSQDVEDRRLICITLREMDRRPKRNSDLKAWSTFARSLDPDVYFPVIVRDTATVFRPPPNELQGLACFDAAALDIQIRMALYERAFLNLLVNNGPIALLYFNEKTRYLQFRPQYDEADTSERYLAKIGFTADYDPMLKTRYQKVSMDFDKIENIDREFNRMMANTKSAPPTQFDQWASANEWRKRFARFGSFDVAEQIHQIICTKAGKNEHEDTEFDLLVAQSASALAEEGYHLDAERGFDLLAKRAPENIEFRFGRLKVLTQLFKIDEIIAELEHLEGLGADMSPLNSLKAQCLTQVGRYEEAVDYFDKHFAMHVPDPNTLFDYSNAVGAIGDINAQIGALERALLLLSPNDKDAIAKIEAALEIARDAQTVS